MPVIYSIDQAPLLIILHLAAALAALAVGVTVLFMKKGTRVHRWFGRAWVTLMLFVAVSSFWIQGRGRFSFIHVLSLVIIVNLSYAIFAIRTKRVRGHQISMVCSFIALITAGAFTLLPYRMLGKLVFGG